MIQKHLFLLLFIWTFVFTARGQNFNNYQHKGDAFYPSTDRYRSWSWFIGPGATYMFPRPDKHQEQVGLDPYNYEADGKWNLFLEAGAHKIFKYPGFFRSMDFGLAYKGLSGKETYYSPNIEGDGSFSEQQALAFFNINNVYEISNPWFIQNSFGLNFDYRFGQSLQASSGFNEQFPGNMELNIHYKLGVGFKATKYLLVIPSVETPLLGFLNKLPFPNKYYFNSWYQPLIFSIRFVFLGKAKEECPPVFAPGMMEGITPDGMSK